MIAGRLVVRFRAVAMSAMGTMASCDPAQAERQETEWTRRWLCICQQAVVSLKPTVGAVSSHFLAERLQKTVRSRMMHA
jgi:hypothetical protein